MEQLQLIRQDVNENKRDVNDVKQDVAVLTNEVQNFKRVMERLDEAITAMSRVSANLERLLIIHEGLIKNNDSNLTNHKSWAEDTFVSVKARILDLEKHRDTMVKWRWQIIGAWSVICVQAVFITKILHIW